jgi:hypothetical protein
MKGRKKRGRYGTLLFAVPIVVVVLAVAYQLISVTYFNTGTLVVQAQSSARYYPSVFLNVSASVGALSGSTGTQEGQTPLTLSLTQGAYTVSFPTVQWYSAPQSRMVNILAGKTSYAVGVYDPIVKGVAIESNQFNATAISAKHGVTPVVWVNKMNSYAVVQGAPTGTIMIQPMTNYTYVFQTPGKYTITLFGAQAPVLNVSIV